MSKNPPTLPDVLDELLDTLEAEASYSDSDAWVTQGSKNQTKQAIITAVRQFVVDNMPEKPIDMLIQEALQQGRPQQAASYNGFAAAIDQATTQLLTALGEEEK
jgi:hypothetical protein